MFLLSQCDKQISLIFRDTLDMPAMSWTIKIHCNLISSVLHLFLSFFLLPKKWFKPYQMPWKGVFTSAVKLLKTTKLIP